MRISNRFAIAVHILSLISMIKVIEDNICTSEFIAGSVNINPVIVRKLISKLRKAGMVKVRAGSGGTYMEKDPKNISLFDVYNAIEVVKNNKLFNYHDSPNPKCPVGLNINFALNETLTAAQNAMEKILKNTTIFDITAMIASRISKRTS
jgi:Rrf2 family protein